MLWLLFVKNEDLGILFDYNNVHFSKEKNNYMFLYIYIYIIKNLFSLFLWTPDSRWIQVSVYERGFVLRKLKSPGTKDRTLWSRGHVPRASPISWLAHVDRPPTRDSILKWQPQINPLCVFRAAADGSRRHSFFFECPVVARASVVRCLYKIGPSAA